MKRIQAMCIIVFVVTIVFYGCSNKNRENDKHKSESKVKITEENKTTETIPEEDHALNTTDTMANDIEGKQKEEPGTTIETESSNNGSQREENSKETSTTIPQNNDPPITVPPTSECPETNPPDENDEDSNKTPDVEI